MIVLAARVTVLLALLSALGWGGHAAWSFATAQPAGSTVLAAPSAVPTQRGALAWTKPALSAFPDTVKRPLFFEGRVYPAPPPPATTPVPPVATTVPALPPPRAPVAAPTGAEPPPATTAGLKLLGIMVVRGQSRALIEAAPATGEWLSAGAKVRDWTIESISADRVSLRQGRQTATLELYTLSPASLQPRTR